MEEQGQFCCSPWGTGEEAWTPNYLCLNHSGRVLLNRQIHLLSIWQRQLKGFGKSQFQHRHLEQRQVPPLIRFPNQCIHPIPASLGSLEEEQGLMCSNCFHRSGGGKKNSPEMWWKGDGKGEEYCCFFPPIKLFVKSFTKGYAVYLFKINTLVSVWKLVPTQDRPINYSVLCAIVELLKVEPYLFLFQINNYLPLCSLLEIDVLFIQCL